MIDKQYHEIMEDTAVRYQRAYDILMEYFDLLPDDIKKKIHKKLKEVDL
jgi:hypothetical protein